MHFSPFFNVYTHTFAFRNAASDNVDQQLIFVGSEAGKMVALRELVQKVRKHYCSICEKWSEDAAAVWVCSHL